MRALHCDPVLRSPSDVAADGSARPTDQQTPAPLRPAAAVILCAPRSPQLRGDSPATDETTPGAFAVLLVRRNQRGAFGGLHVYPGGAIDPHDRAMAAAETPSPPLGDTPAMREVDAAAELAMVKVAAIRETLEEVGVAFIAPSAPSLASASAPASSALASPPPAASRSAVASFAAALETIRRTVHADGSQFAVACAAHGVRPATEALVPWARWATPANHAGARFDTWFLVALQAAGVGAVRPDGAELLDATWLRPAVALARAQRGAIKLLPPQWVTLQQLSRLSWAQLRTWHERQQGRDAVAQQRALPAIQPVKRALPGNPAGVGGEFLLNGDCEHPAPAEGPRGRYRVRMRWVPAEEPSSEGVADATPTSEPNLKPELKSGYLRIEWDDEHDRSRFPAKW
ncbi:hypothetical protein CXG81DRAFT_19848 [Caulochytrium protostelioides]|uniref:Nudix hydrolase domain-containing protein n=1 Tax=Caulochytrium protostelioides TaxID=1555241 RepID=A0A4P9X4Y2_9FUNG|nr:hypothetical protein CXG81DRAFT_19848 [Caulochytrium protostelioides]|eukprot:RKP00153.1 hypothetical protein CXG81DRAFT_19848 [Caulochytrium protostelioides]